MLDGLRGTGLTKELGKINDSLRDLRDGQKTANSILSDIDKRSQEVLNGIRALSRDRANAGVSCPSLLTIGEGRTRGLLRRTQITVTLWCEWPSGPHPLDGKNGNYPIIKVPEALARYLPYLRDLIMALGLAAPALGSLGIELSNQVQNQVDAATRTLTFIEKHVNIAGQVAEHGARSPDRHTIRAETGADFRALHNMLHDLDPDDNWGGLSAVPRPEDQSIIWLCPHHIRDLEYPYAAARPN